MLIDKKILYNSLDKISNKYADYGYKFFIAENSSKYFFDLKKGVVNQLIHTDADKITNLELEARKGNQTSHQWSFHNSNYKVDMVISPPKKLFNKNTFIMKVSEKYNIPVNELDALADECKTETAPNKSFSSKIVV